MKLTPNAVKAIGERIVANELTYRGWLAVNTNSGEENSPNIDIIALKDGKRVTIQVKSTNAKCKNHSYHLGRYQKDDGECYFNTKAGVKADFVVAVYLFSPNNYSCLITPIKEAESMCQQHGAYWANKPKKDGAQRSTNFPIYIEAKNAANYGLVIDAYVDAWELLE